MKPQLLKVATNPAHSFSVRQDRFPNINNRWHYHVEVELIYFHKGSGTQFVGDHIKRFNQGDIVLVGSNLPHYWRYDDVYLQQKETTLPYSTVIHFKEDFWGNKFLDLPENKVIKSVLERAKRGILINGFENKKISGLIEKIRKSDGVSRIIALIQCLEAFAGCDNSHVLSSLGFNYDYSESENERINTIYEYTLQNFQERISLEQISSLAGFVPNSFCRYFKYRTGKTYSQFLIEIRIGHACKLLIENRMNMKQVCYESGFNNFTCFHKNFKTITGKTPQVYQKEFIK